MESIRDDCECGNDVPRNDDCGEKVVAHNQSNSYIVSSVSTMVTDSVFTDSRNGNGEQELGANFQRLSSSASDSLDGCPVARNNDGAMDDANIPSSCENSAFSSDDSFRNQQSTPHSQLSSFLAANNSEKISNEVLSSDIRGKNSTEQSCLTERDEESEEMQKKLDIERSKRSLQVC